MIFKKTILAVLTVLICTVFSLSAESNHRAGWMEGKWGFRFNMPSTKDLDALNKFDVDCMIDQIKVLHTAGWIQINISQGANGSYYVSPHPELTENIHPDMAPDRDLFGEMLEALLNENFKVMVYFATEGPTMGKHPDKAIPGTIEIWKDYVASKGMTPEQGVAEIIVKYYSQKYGDKISGWWFDHATYGDVKLLRAAALSGNPDAVVTFNVGGSAELKTNKESDFTAGHPTPMKQAPPSSDVNLLSIEMMEKNNYVDTSLAHFFPPMQMLWNSGDPAFTKEKAVEWTMRMVKAGGSMTWAVALEDFKNKQAPLASVQFEQLKAINQAYLDYKNEKLKNFPKQHSSPYCFSFEEYLQWNGDITDSSANAGIFIEKSKNGGSVLSLKTTKSDGAKSVNYNTHLSIGQNYMLQFRAKVDKYDSGNSWPLRVIVKDGRYNLTFVIQGDGIYYTNKDGVKTRLANAPNAGEWHTYTVKVANGLGTLYVDDNAKSYAINSLKPQLSQENINLSVRAATADLSAQVSFLNLIPKPLSFSEKWKDLSNWNISTTDVNTYTIINGSQNFLKMTNGAKPGEVISTLVPQVSKNYTVRTQFSINNFGTGKYPLALQLFNAATTAAVKVATDGMIKVLNGSTYVDNSLKRKLVAGEVINLELEVVGVKAKLWELSPAGKKQLHAWTLPPSVTSSRINIESNGTNSEVSIFQIDYTDETLVDHKNNEVAHETISFDNGEEFGVSKFGGGYGSQFRLHNGGTNILSPGFGAGWVSAVRSKMHGDGNYNPTQAGASDAEGAPTLLMKTKNGSGKTRIQSATFQAPLFVLDSRIRDWIENEPLKNTDGTNFSDKKSGDGGHSDIDGIDESHRTMADEIRSELDFTAEWEDATNMSSTGQSILRHYSRWDYKRNPDALLQFNKQAGLVEESYRIADLSPSHYSGNQQPTDIDLSMFLNTYSIRLEKAEGYKYFMWKEDGVWQSKLADASWTHVGIGGTDSSLDPYLNGTALGNVSPKMPNLSAQANNDLMIISKTGQPDDPDAVGLYIPWHSQINANSIMGYSRTDDQQVFSEDRRINAYFTISLRNNKWVTIFTRMWHLGLQTPNHGDPDVYESLQNEYLHIMGTPEKIMQTVTEMEAKLSPISDITVTQIGRKIIWSTENENGIREYKVVDKDNTVISKVIADGSKQYAVTLKSTAHVKIIIVDKSGSQQIFTPDNKDVRTAVYNLKKGWNMIAVTGDYADLYELKSMSVGNMWAWDGEKYIVTDGQKAFTGMWVFALADSDNLKVPALKAGSNLIVDTGWTLTGPASDVARHKDITTFSWNSDKYLPVIAVDNALKKGQGYWLFAENETAITVDVD